MTGVGSVGGEAEAALAALEDLECTMILTDENQKPEESEDLQRLKERVLRLEMDVVSLMKMVHSLTETVDVALDVSTRKTNEEQDYVPVPGLRDPAIG